MIGEHAVSPFRRQTMLLLGLQPEVHVNPPHDEHIVFLLDLANALANQPPA